MSKLEQIKECLAELDEELWARARYLAAMCTPYDMDEDYVRMLKEEKYVKAGLEAEEERLKKEDL